MDQSYGNNRKQNGSTSDMHPNSGFTPAVYDVSPVHNGRYKVETSNGRNTSSGTLRGNDLERSGYGTPEGMIEVVSLYGDLPTESYPDNDEDHFVSIRPIYVA